jgi:hypothetical protein
MEATTTPPRIFEKAVEDSCVTGSAHPLAAVHVKKVTDTVQMS